MQQAQCFLHALSTTAAHQPIHAQACEHWVAAVYNMHALVISAGAVPGLTRLEDILKFHTDIKCPHIPLVHHFRLEVEMYPGKPCQLPLTFDGGVDWHHFLLCLSWFPYSSQLMWFSLPRTGSDAEAHKQKQGKKNITFRQVGRACREKSRKPSEVETYIEQRNESELGRIVFIMAVVWKILHREDSFCVIYTTSWCSFLLISIYLYYSWLLYVVSIAVTK